MRWVSTRVLPEPAPATISSGPSVWMTASYWTGLRPSRRSSSPISAPYRWPTTVPEGRPDRPAGSARVGVAGVAVAVEVGADGRIGHCGDAVTAADQVHEHAVAEGVDAVAAGALDARAPGDGRRDRRAGRGRCRRRGRGRRSGRRRGLGGEAGRARRGGQRGRRGDRGVRTVVAVAAPDEDEAGDREGTDQREGSGSTHEHDATQRPGGGCGTVRGPGRGRHGWDGRARRPAPR